MRRQRQKHTDVWKQYEKGVTYKTDTGVYDTVRTNENFFIGKQWEGVESGGLPTPVFNFLKRVVLFTVAGITSSRVKLQAAPIGSGDDTTNADDYDQTLPVSAQQQLESLSAQYDDAAERGAWQDADRLHQQAEDLRAVYGYSGGADGTGYIPLTNQPEPTSARYINTLYDAQNAAAQAALENAYSQSIAALDAERAAVGSTYDAAKNDAAARSAVERSNFDEYAAASGLSSGAGTQAALAYSNVLQGDLSALGAAEAAAETALDTQQSALTVQHQYELARAGQSAALDRAGALLDEYNTQRAVSIERDWRDADQAYNTMLFNAESEQDAYRRALSASEATGVYSGMGPYGWSSEQIARAERLWQQDYGF